MLTNVSASTLAIDFHLSSLPQTLRLCDAPRYFSVDYDLEDVNSPDYYWLLVNERDAAGLSVRITSPQQLSIPCTSYTESTATALSANVSLNGASVPASLNLDYAHATLTVEFDATNIQPQDRSGQYASFTIGHLVDNYNATVVNDFGPSLSMPQSDGETSASDPPNDLVEQYQGISPPTDWSALHGFLDLLGVTARWSDTKVAAAATVAIGPGITGSWYDPNQSGHGLALEVLDGSRLLAYWFTFTPDGSQQAWFLGVGSYSGNTATIAQVAQPQGGRWIPNFDPSKITQQPWGALTLTFSDCNHGRVDFSSTVPGYGSGHMDLTRLTMPAGLSCP
jgi:hypothetical protein